MLSPLLPLRIGAVLVLDINQRSAVFAHQMAMAAVVMNVAGNPFGGNHFLAKATSGHAGSGNYRFVSRTRGNRGMIKVYTSLRRAFGVAGPMCISASVNRNGGDVTLLTCSFCNEPIEIKPAKTDEYGDAVHEACYVLRMQKSQVGEPDGSNRRLQDTRVDLDRPCYRSLFGMRRAVYHIRQAVDDCHG